MHCFKDFYENLCVPSVYTAWNGAEVKMRSTMFWRLICERRWSVEVCRAWLSGSGRCQFHIQIILLLELAWWESGWTYAPARNEIPAVHFATSCFTEWDVLAHSLKMTLFAHTSAAGGLPEDDMFITFLFIWKYSMWSLTLKIHVFRNVMLYQLLNSYRCFKVL